MGQNRRYDRKKLSGRVNKQDQVLLVRLAQECAEVQHAVAKALRWGWTSRHPHIPYGMNNEQNIAKEVGDVHDIYNRLLERGRLK